MKRDHCGFFMFLACLLIAPEISVGALFGSPGRADMSLGLVGLMIWILLSPRHLINVKRIFYQTPAFGVLLFSFYTLIASFVSNNIVSIIYAGQYFIYAFLVFRMVSGYLDKVVRCDQFHITKNIVLIITIIVTFGTIFSFWLGPIYPKQAFWVARTVGNVWVQRAVGFTGNPNSAGAILLILVPLSLSFIYGTPINKWSSVVVLLGMIAILTTISRSAILSGVAAFCIVVMIRCLRLLFTGKVKVRIIRLILLLTLTTLLVICALSFFNLDTTYALGAFGIGTDVGGIHERVAIWKSWFEKWKEMGSFPQLFGAGFRSGAEISIYGTFSTPHNSYIEMLFDFGMFGLFLFIMPLLWTISHASARLIIYKQAGVELFILIGLLSSTIHNMSETFFYSPNILSLVIIMLIYYYIYSNKSLKLKSYVLIKKSRK